MPSEAETKSARQLEGNWFSPSLLTSGMMPLTERQLISCPGRRASGPACPQPLTLSRMALLLISCRSAGPSLSFSSTPGRQGSMTISAWVMRVRTTWKCSLCLRLIATHFLFLFMMFLWMGMATGADSARATITTSAPWSAKYIPQKTLGASPSNYTTRSLCIQIITTSI